MKILWHSNAPWAQTGYGQQTAMFVPRLAAQGHDVAISAFWGLGGASLNWGEFRVYPADNHWGNRMLGPYAAHHAQSEDLRDCLVITLMDVWVLSAPGLRDLRLASWCPVDHDPLPPKVLAYFKQLGARPIAMSRFGEDKMREAGLDPLYVPHGVETSIFRPLDERAEIREALNVPEGSFLVGMVANNKGTAPPRKAFPQAFEAFARLRERHPEALLYLHSEKFGLDDGINLVALLEFCGVPETAVRWPSQFELEFGIPQGSMSFAYNAMDVLLCPSYGEGFGIPIVEAQACGTPVIVNDFSAMPELVGAGWRVEGEPWYEASQGSFYQCPSIADITEALLDSVDRAPQMREMARSFAKAYDADLVAEEFWKPAVEALAAEPERGLNRAQRRAKERKQAKQKPVAA